MLPLTVTPKPAAGPLRVGIVFQPHWEDEAAITEQAQRLIKQLDDDEFTKRESATAGLIELGPAALRLVREALDRGGSAEVRERCKKILENVDASNWLKEPGK